MGHGIAQVAAACGFQVLLNDVNREALSRGVESIERNLAKGIQLGKLTEDDRDRTLQQIQVEHRRVSTPRTRLRNIPAT
jgi:3-hydroxybutyryl-CoA dehydrogenase